MIKKDMHILGKAVTLRQIEGGFHTGLDAVMLAAACPAKAGDNILDLGCGVGGAGLAALHRVNGATLTGIEIQQDHADLARENAAANGMESRAEFICADIRDFREQSARQTNLLSGKTQGTPHSTTNAGDAATMPEVKVGRRFNHVICNPPYLEAGTHAPSPSAKRAKALGHDDTTLEEWIACAFDCLKGQGSLTMIHRADHIDKIILALGKRFGALQIVPLWPSEGEPAKRVILRCYKHKKSPAEIHPGIVLHHEDGSYTEAAEGILREAKAL